MSISISIMIVLLTWVYCCERQEDAGRVCVGEAGLPYVTPL
jgi:hypothetical protein